MYWPLSLYFPIAMYMRVYQPPKNVRTVLNVVSVIMLAVCISAVAGAVRNIIVNLQDDGSGL